MTTDYDALRVDSRQDATTLLGEFASTQDRHVSSFIDAVDATVTGVILPGADLSYLDGEELAGPVLAKQLDEFTCSRCFLILHRNRITDPSATHLTCRDCA